MAQQVSQVNYFPVSVNFYTDPKIAFIEAEFGLRGIAIIHKLLSHIYNHSFFCEWNEDLCMLFTKHLGAEVDEEYVQRVVDRLIKRDFFDKGKYEEYGILTSKGIQKRYFDITSRRKNLPEFPGEYLLLDLSSHKNMGKKKLKSGSCSKNESSTPGNETSGEENADKNRQRREEERKEEKSREEQSTAENAPSCECAGELCGDEMEKGKNVQSFQEICRKWREKLMADEDWRAAACRQSGMGTGFLSLIPEKMELFEDHIVSIGEKKSIVSEKDYARRFRYWWINHGLKQHSEQSGKRMAGRESADSPGKGSRCSRIEEMQHISREATEMALKLLGHTG